MVFKFQSKKYFRGEEEDFWVRKGNLGEDFWDDRSRGWEGESKESLGGLGDEKRGLG